jgi:hypothetical protein
MDGSCSMHGRNEKYIQNVGSETWWEETIRKS